jgi:hypothetical protein
MSPPLCATGCGRPSPAAALCTTCTNALRLDLLAVPWLTRALTTTLARLDRVPAGAGAGTDETPLPFRFAATQAATTLRLTLEPWVRDVAELHGLPAPRRRATLAALARWLARHDVLLRRHPADPDPQRGHGGAAQMADEIRYAVGQVRRVIDRPPDLFYGGPCDGCRQDLYCGADSRGWPTAVVITCRTCARVYDAAERRAWLLESVRDRLAPAAEISQAVPALYGQEIRAGTIRQWVARGRLVPHAWLLAGVVYPHRPADHARALLRVGDVIDLAERTAS